VARTCAYCLTDNPAPAQYCRECGRELLEPIPGDQPQAVADQPAPAAMTCPVGFTPCVNSNEIYYRWDAVGVGSFFGCEYLGVTLVNGGQTVVDVELQLTGRDAERQVLFELQRKVHRLERGQSMSLEIAQHELPAMPEHLDLTVVSVKPPPDKESAERRKSCQRPWWSSSWEESS